MTFSKDAKKQRSRILIFLALSLAVHLLFLWITPIYWSATEPKKEESTVVEIDPNLLQELDKNRGQVAETEKALNKTPPKETKFVGERDQTVEEETKARNAEKFRQGEGAPSAAKQPSPTLSLKNLAPKQVFTPPTQEEAIDEQQKLEKQEQREMAAAQAGGQDLGSSTTDYLKDVKEGKSTMLSTKEFVYFSYYRRIREQLELAWNNKLRNTIESYVYSGRQLASERSYVTRLIVVLDRHGRIKNVQMLSGSGAHDLDQAAIDAFNQAGPFPDPPNGLIDKDGSIKIPWDFVLQS